MMRKQEEKMHKIKEIKGHKNVVREGGNPIVENICKSINIWVGRQAMKQWQKKRAETFPPPIVAFFIFHLSMLTTYLSTLNPIELVGE
jgi:hypothetical protein